MGNLIWRIIRNTPRADMFEVLIMVPRSFGSLLMVQAIARLHRIT